MSIMKTIPEQEADESVKKQYNLLKQACGSSHVPLFFTYIGPFPKYLEYITEQIVQIVTDSRFEKLNYQMGQDISKLIHSMLKTSPEVLDWFARYQHTPSFYNLEKDLEQIYRTNITLALVFVALRESVKGWAVAAKKLPSNISEREHEKNVQQKADAFVMDSFEPFKTQSESIIRSTHDTVETASQIEVNLFPEYLRLQQMEYFEIVKSEAYVMLRLYIEELILATLPLLPHPLISPVNVVLELTTGYTDFPHLLYVLSEQFPTLAVQRLIFSGYVLSHENM